MWKKRIGQGLIAISLLLAGGLIYLLIFENLAFVYLIRGGFIVPATFIMGLKYLRQARLEGRRKEIENESGKGGIQCL